MVYPNTLTTDTSLKKCNKDYNNNRLCLHMFTVKLLSVKACCISFTTHSEL